MAKLFLKALKASADFIGSLMPFVVSLTKLFGDATSIVINWTGCFSAIKGISSALSDIFKYKEDKKDKVYLIINIVATVVYVCYFCIIIGAAALGKLDNEFVMWMSHIALIISPAKDLYNAVKGWVVFAKSDN